MYRKQKLLPPLILVLLFFVLSAARARSPQDLFPSFPDKHTVGLWLFDETEYPYTTLTDASGYEYDLRLQKEGELVAGKFGSALKVAPGMDYAVNYVGFKGSVPIEDMGDNRGTPSRLWGPTEGPGKLVNALAGPTWTCEFWLNLATARSTDVAIIDLGQAYDPGFSLVLKASAAKIEIKNAYAGLTAVCATNVTPGSWHHVAFTCAGSAVRHFLDGTEQPAPAVSPISRQPLPDLEIPSDRKHDSRGFSASKDFEWRRGHRFNFSIGQDRRGNKDMTGMIDELRICDIVRYSSNFEAPPSFSRNYGPNRPKPALPNGPPLLFAPDSPKGAVQLGSRKHLFVDDALVDKMQNVQLTCNRPTERRNLNFRPGRSSWRASVMDVDGKVYMYIPDGYGSGKGITRLRISEDGVNFKTPSLGVTEFEGSRNNDYVFAGVPLYGSFFEDLNPSKKPEERYKMTAWVANRGIYLYMSPDGIHWRRNESCMLPLVSGGGAETYWDDQRGLYVDFIKRDSSFRTREYGGRGRRACMFETREILKPWPFRALEKPYFERWPMPSVTGEGPVIFAPNKNGQVYRTRAIKYPWAPDTYLAFVWRFGEGERRQVDLGVSRDGINWRFYADASWYMTPGEDEEVLSLYGLIRRGDQIWQYADYGGAHGGSKERTYARLTQRLDGFVSLDVGGQTGTLTTRPLTFDGNKLALNINANGGARVAILSGDGKPMRGFSLGDCDRIKGDHIRRTVAWNGTSDVGPLAGKVIRLKFEMQNAKLYAFEFNR
ncbi:MAG: LamG-like jellyroll fold domain-containing protein [Planctomycetota bacterium]|jgi:hypothetical protein